MEGQAAKLLGEVLGSAEEIGAENRYRESLTPVHPFDTESNPAPMKHL